MPIITLLTDFGLTDTFIGVMKGVIWSIAPDVKIADLTHNIRPQNVLEGAYSIADAAPYFPAGTIHVCVVDPGVGTARRPMAASIGDQLFVGPDNGLFTLLIEKAKDFPTPPVYMHLNRPRFWLPSISYSFHGRDIFAPVAAHLAAGAAFEELGDPISDPVRIPIPEPQKTAEGWQGQVIQIDHFGNLITNLSRVHLPPGGGVNLHVGETLVSDFVTSFGSRPPGALVAMIDSSGRLAISEVNGSAAARLGIHEDEPVLLAFTPEGKA
ncbi:MAG: hypothetical protein FD147_2419 [Chloroflexi bacterium]|nr:MAG: hypothetical protein FD147_2419 [Chloroflexota bacterium]MBA4376800.1 hypothetical protein [Anaerolinea sp.]